MPPPLIRNTPILGIHTFPSCSGIAMVDGYIAIIDEDTDRQRHRVSAIDPFQCRGLSKPKRVFLETQNLKNIFKYHKDVRLRSVRWCVIRLLSDCDRFVGL
ncbi:hypothetical protein ACU8KH_00972 [Lachancea thermotolerans]